MEKEEAFCLVLLERWKGDKAASGEFSAFQVSLLAFP
jgi:hypothetical protein